MRRLDKNLPDIRPGEILVFACVRNESLRLPFFLKYYRNLGVNRFFFIDNDSTDSTTNYLLSQSDVHVFHTRSSYAESKCGVDWLNELLTLYGRDHWILTLDADELLIYPLCEKVALRGLTDFLDNAGADSLVTFLLDMYSDKAIKDTAYVPGTPFVELCGYFDCDTYHEKGGNGVPVRGGPRHRLFWSGLDREKSSPYLGKIPLIKWRKGLEFEASTHVIKNIQPAKITGALQHFKFFSDFYQLVQQEAARKEHWDDAAQYKSYWSVMKKTPNLCALYEGSLAYIDSAQLLDLGLMKSSVEFEQHFKSY